MRLRPLTLSLTLALAASCGDKDGSGDDVSGDTGEIVEADGDADADADTDTDADADADTDADSDADTDADGDADTDVEDCDDGVDNDADGKKDCKDPDCDAECVEDCSDGKDNDGDLYADCDDTDCAAAEGCYEVCGDGSDNDGDLFADCDDPDCVDYCLEDCADGADNDADGAADCADDECYGDVNCTFDYDITYSISLNTIYVFADKYVVRYSGYAGAGLASGEVTLSATPTSAGKAFTCTGTIDVGGSYLGMHGLDWSKAGCSSCDFTFYLAPSAVEGSLSWDGYCPIDTLPSSRIALKRGDYDVQRYDSAKARWSDQYSAAVHTWDSTKATGYGYWSTMSTASSLSFSGAY
ncbi:hypothetical protein L6R49_20950 [Myxococcota bacterium]|nr:hypothetical protein [Myxococcota bacterium]